DAVRGPAFFVRGHCENDVATRCVTLLLHSNQGCGHDGIAVLHVAGAAPVEEALLLDELEWIGRPVLAAGFDNVEMTNQQDRLVLARPMQTYNNVLFAVVGT